MRQQLAHGGALGGVPHQGQAHEGHCPGGQVGRVGHLLGADLEQRLLGVHLQHHTGGRGRGRSNSGSCRQGQQGHCLQGARYTHLSRPIRRLSPHCLAYTPSTETGMVTPFLRSRITLSGPHNSPLPPPPPPRAQFPLTTTKCPPRPSWRPPQPQKPTCRHLHLSFSQCLPTHPTTTHIDPHRGSHALQDHPLTASKGVAPTSSS